MGALVAAAQTSAQTSQKDDPQFQIQVDVTGKALKEKRKDQWGEVRTKNFVIAGDADEKDLHTAASELELFRADFASMFPRAKETSSIPTRVIVFRDRQSLRSYRPQSDSASAESYLQVKPDLNYLVLGAGEKLSPDIMREYARLLMRDSMSPVPLWMETGIVEYFSAYKLIRLGEDRIVKLGIDEYKGGFSEKNLMPLNLLLTIDRESFKDLNPELQKIFHTESCLLFQYLLQTRRIGPALRMTNAMAEGMPLEQAFRNMFKLTPAAVLENLKNHIKLSKFGGWAITLEGLTLDRKKQFVRITSGLGFRTVRVYFDELRTEIEALPVRILSDAEADVYRGDLQLHNDRFAEGRRCFFRPFAKTRRWRQPTRPSGTLRPCKKITPTLMLRSIKRARWTHAEMHWAITTRRGRSKMKQRAQELPSRYPNWMTCMRHCGMLWIFLRSSFPQQKCLRKHSYSSTGISPEPPGFSSKPFNGRREERAS